MMGVMVMVMMTVKQQQREVPPIDEVERDEPAPQIASSAALLCCGSDKQTYLFPSSDLSSPLLFLSPYCVIKKKKIKHGYFYCD